jgi:hypothetical protein
MSLAGMNLTYLIGETRPLLRGMHLTQLVSMRLTKSIPPYLDVS